MFRLIHADVLVPKHHASSLTLIINNNDHFLNY